MLLVAGLLHCLAVYIKSGKIISRRLKDYLEGHNTLDSYHYGFRSARSTVDHLVGFKTAVRAAFINKQHCLFVFIDLAKVYNTALRLGILQDLIDNGIFGRMFGVIKSYLEGRSFRVKLGTTFSRAF